ncbi:MAG: carbamoyltransferase HypF [Pseudomonadota bacterium]|nr:carbamoyltransferase HypF [Pseudomonadota bacterium]
MAGERIRVTGIVQGVGFRPTVWRLANECGIAGQVWNDAEGVLIHAWGNRESLERFVRRLRSEPPPLARIDRVVRSALDEASQVPKAFQIVDSRTGMVRTGVAADATTCPECLAEVLDPANRRYRYPFTNCTHCGPRLSIVRAIPYDRANTSMASFPMCPQCRAEYEQPADRRFHAQPNACGECGPRVWLEDAAGNRRPPDGGIDEIETAARLIRRGHIVAIKGIGGFHLACDAGNEDAVDTLRRRKHRYHKALALMARDIAMVARFAGVNAQEAALLRDRAAPIVVLDASGEALAAGLAPRQRTLGFMLPYTPLHHLLMQDMARPIVLTSGNRCDEPQTVDNQDAHRRLDRIADDYLLHDRDIVNRLDDSVLRVADGTPRFLRRARGYAPQPILLAGDLAESDGILAMGGELKNTFCLLNKGRAVLSQHIGDLEDAVTLRDYRRNLDLFLNLFDHRPTCVVVDEHPDYFSTRLGQKQAREAGLKLVEVQHHHAHVAACLAEHGMPLDAGPVLGVVLDGLGFGRDETFWGGEFLLADYFGFRRLARFQPVAMPGGARAMHEPWRNTWAHLFCAFGREPIRDRYKDLDIVRFLETRPLQVLQTMVEKGLNSPPASSCGRLFDAVAAAIGVCREAVSHEGQAAIELESLATPEFRRQAQYGYPCDVTDDGGLRTLTWRRLWEALLEDIRRGIKAARIAARFHQGLAQAVAESALDLCRHNNLDTVVLGGGVFQNRLLLEGVSERLRETGIRVLSPARVPAGDGGLALGQAAIAAAKHAGH